MIVYAMDAIQNPVSLFEPVYTEGGDTLYVMDQISDKKNREEKWVENLSLREALERLSDRERHIIEMRFYDGKTQMEVAEEVGISQAQVSRLEKNALKSMKNFWEHKENKNCRRAEVSVYQHFACGSFSFILLRTGRIKRYPGLSLHLQLFQILQC